MNPAGSSRQPPKLYIMTGLPYSGKTTLRKALVKCLHWEAVSVDEIMDARDMWRAGHPTQEDWNDAYAEAYHRIEVALWQGKTVIFDCANLPYRERATARAIAKKSGIQSTVIYVNIPKDEIFRRRLENAETQARGQLDDEMMERAFTLFEEPTREEHPVVYQPQFDLDEWIATFLAGQQEMA